MTFASSGTTAFAQTVLNTTNTQAGVQVLAPAYGTTGTAQPAVTITGTLPSKYGDAAATVGVSSGTAGYPVLYGSAAAQLITPGAIPAQNGYQGVNAQASQSGNNTVNGLAGYGSAQGIAQNQAARPDVSIPVAFDLIYQQLLTMNAYVSRI